MHLCATLPEASWLFLGSSASPGCLRVSFVASDSTICCVAAYSVQGYPTIKVFGEDKERPNDYSGAREEGSLTSFALDLWRQTLPPPEVGLPLLPLSS